MDAKFNLPESGVVAGHVVDAFDLRRWNHTVLSGRNASRFFAGKLISAEAQAEMWRAVAQALARSELLPSSMRLAEPTPGRTTESVSAELFGRCLVQSAERWDRIVGALRAHAPPIGSPRLANGAVLRVAVVDLSVRAAAMHYLMDAPAEALRLPRIWYARARISERLNALRCAAGLTLDQLAERARVEPSALDGWIYERGARPNSENLADLANALAETDAERSALARELGTAYGMRAIFKRVEDGVGVEAAAALVARLRAYPPALLAAVRANEQPVEQNDIAMRLTLLRGATRDDAGMILPWVGLLLDALARAERDPVWRTTVRALPRGWHDHLLDVATRLAPISEAALRQVCEAVPPPELLELATYLSQASPKELGREPILGAVLEAQLRRGGRPTAIELNRRAIPICRGSGAHQTSAPPPNESPRALEVSARHESHPLLDSRRAQGTLKLHQNGRVFSTALEYAADKALLFRKLTLNCVNACAEHYDGNGCVAHRAFLASMTG